MSRNGEIHHMDRMRQPEMLGSDRNKWLIRGMLLAASVILAGLLTAVWADSPERTSMHVVVKDAETGQPIFQAGVTLEFREPGSRLKLKRSKLLSYHAKTNAQGRCKFLHIPKGTVRLKVIAERHQTYGKELELEQDDQVFEVKLRTPQPFL